MICFLRTLLGRTYELLMSGNGSGSDFSDWQATGGVEVKGKGQMETYVWREMKEARRPSIEATRASVDSLSASPHLPVGSFGGSNSGRMQRPSPCPSVASKTMAAAAVSGKLHSRITNLDQVQCPLPASLTARLVK